MRSEVMVSINCTTYNHEDFIVDAIESFLMQKTNFNFEILIHDDASTDRTPYIIREYEKKYPDLIKPIYQTENLYSKRIKVGPFNGKRAIGKYIAICEGDDYWTDPYKLQKQVDYMEKHLECSMCVHAAYRVSSNGEKLKSHIKPNFGNKTFSVEKIIEGGGGLFATNSIMYRRILGLNRPYFYEKARIGDYPLAIYMALQGTVYYIDEFMSNYRVNVKGSWTDREFSSIDKQILHYDMVAEMLDEVNRYTGHNYNTVIEKTKKQNQFNLLLNQNKFQEIRRIEFKEFYSSLKLKNKVALYIKQYLPGFAKILIKIKRRMFNV